MTSLRALRRVGLSALLLTAPVACTPRRPSPPAEALVSAKPAGPPPASAPSAAPASAALDGGSCPARKVVGTVSFAPDGQSLLTACSGGDRVCGSDAPDWDPFVDVWDLRQGRLAKRLDAGMSNIGLVWGPGNLLATVADPTTGVGEVRVFDGATFGLRLQASHYCITGVDFDPRGAVIAIAGADGQIETVETTSGKTRRRPEKEAHVGGDYSVSVKFTPDARTLFVADESAGLQSLSAATLREIAGGGASARLECTAVEPGRALFAATDEAGALFVVKTSEPRRRLTLATEPDRKCTALAWVDPTHFVLAASTGRLTLWDATGKTPRRELRAPSGTTMTTVAPAPTGATLATVDSAGAVALWDVATATPGRVLLGAPADEAERAEVLAWSPRGDRLAAFAGHRLLVWDVASGAAVVELPSQPPAKSSRRIEWRSDGGILAAVDEMVRLVRLADRAVVTLAVVERDGQRVGLVGADSGAYAGPADLAGCAPRSGSARPARTELRPSLLADFVAGLPVGGAP